MVIFCHRFGVVVEAKIVMDSGLVRWYAPLEGRRAVARVTTATSDALVTVGSVHTDAGSRGT